MALRCKFKIAFLCVFLFFTFQEISKAAEWSALPSITLREDYDDNVLLTTQPHDSVTSIWVIPKLDLSIASNIWQIGAGAELTRRRFPGHHEFDSDGQDFNLASSYRTERSIWQLNTVSSRDSYLTRRLISPDAGLFSENRKSDTKTVKPGWTWLMTELTQLQILYSQTDVSYVNGESIDLHDYRSSMISMKLSHNLNISTQVYFAPAYSFFRVPSTTFESKAASYQFGVERTFSETMRGVFSVGGRNTSSESEVLVCKLLLGSSCIPGAIAKERIFSRDSSSIFSAYLDKRFDRISMNIAASRSFDIAATAQQVRTDSVSVTLSKPLTAKLTSNLAISGYKANSETGQVVGLDRKIYQITPGLNWRWTPELNLETSYRYTHLKADSETKAATSNMVYLTLIYQWPKISISR